MCLHIVTINFGMLTQVMFQFADIAAASDEIKFPDPAQGFVEALGVFNLDFVGYVPAACVWRDASFYTTLTVKTIGPVMVIGTLVTMGFCHMTVLIANATRPGAKPPTTPEGLAPPPLAKQIQNIKRDVRVLYSTYILLFLELVLPSTSTTLFATFVWCAAIVRWFCVFTRWWLISSHGCAMRATVAATRSIRASS